MFIEHVGLTKLQQRAGAYWYRSTLFCSSTRCCGMTSICFLAFFSYPVLLLLLLLLLISITFQGAENTQKSGAPERGIAVEGLPARPSVL